MKLLIPLRVVVGSLTVLAIAAGPASASTFGVDNTADTNLTTCSTAPNDCTLRGALNDANATPGPNTIRLPARRITVKSPLPRIATRLAVKGVSARSSIIDAANAVGTVLASDFGSDTSLQDLQVTGAQRTAHNADFAVSVTGLLQRVAVIDNQSSGVFANNTTIVDSLIARNTGEGVGGVESMGGGSISNSTIADNTAVLSGIPPLSGPLVWTGGVIDAGLLEIDHSTIAGNDVVAGAALFTGTNLGAVGLTNPALVVRSSVIGGSPPPNCGGAISSNGHNVDSGASCHFLGGGDRSRVDPLLAPLANNGGPTDTMALLPGSPAIDAGDSCPPADQRGQTRSQGRTCDSGAFESSFSAAMPADTPSPTTARPTMNLAPSSRPPVRDSTLVPRDTTPPSLTLGRLAKTVTRKELRTGLKVRVGSNEPIAAAVELLVVPRRASIVRVHDLAITTLSLTRAGAARTVKLRSKHVLRGTRRVRGQLRVTAYDAAHNRSAKTINFTIR